MTAHSNLLRDDFQLVARRVVRQVRNEGRTLVRVLPTGALRYGHPAKIDDVAVDTVVGIYHDRTPIEQVEDDLLARLRELQA